MQVCGRSFPGGVFSATSDFTDDLACRQEISDFYGNRAKVGITEEFISTGVVHYDVTSPAYRGGIVPIRFGGDDQAVADAADGNRLSGPVVELILVPVPYEYVLGRVTMMTIPVKVVISLRTIPATTVSPDVSLSAPFDREYPWGSGGIRIGPLGTSICLQSGDQILKALPGDGLLHRPLANLLVEIVKLMTGIGFYGKKSHRKEE